MTVKSVVAFNEFKKELQTDKPIEIDSYKKKLKWCLCKSSNDICLQCQIIELKIENKLLKEKIVYFNGDSSEALNIPSYFPLNKYIDIYPSSDLPYINPNNETLFFPIETTYFITITFDPDKFSNYNDPNKEEDYILYILAQLYKNENIKNFYGCFEKHKTGKIHSHLIATIYDITPFRTSIKKSFTNNMRNLRAVDIGTYKLNKSIDYINKEEEYKKYYSNKNISPIKNI